MRGKFCFTREVNARGMQPGLVVEAGTSVTLKSFNVGKYAGICLELTYFLFLSAVESAILSFFCGSVAN